MRALYLKLSRATNVVPAALAIALLSSACSDTTLGTRSFEEALPTVTIPGGDIQLGLNNFAIPVRLNLATQDAYADGDFDFVSSVKVLSLTLNIDDSSESDQREDGNLDDFDFLSGLQVSLRANINGTLRTDLVASLPDGDPQYASGTRTLNLTTTDVDVLDYIELGSGYDMVITVSGFVPMDNVIINGDIRYRVGIGFR